MWGSSEHAPLQAMHPSDAHEYRKQTHSCTDPICCLLFVVALAAWGGAYVYGLVNGNVGKVFHGMDWQNQICGVTEGVIDKPYLYYCIGAKEVQRTGMQANWEPTFSDSSRPICITACPLVSDSTTFIPYTNGSVESFQVFNPFPECPEPTMGYKTINLLNRYCVPDMEKLSELYPDMMEQMTNISSGQLSSSATEAFETVGSVMTAWPIMVGCFVLALVMGYCYLLLLQCCAAPLLYITMAASILIFAVLSAWLIICAEGIKAQIADNDQIPSTMTDNMDMYTTVAGVLCGVIALALACIMFCFRSSIGTAVACMEVSCQAIWEMPVLLLYPLGKAVYKLVQYTIIFYGFVLLFSCGTVETYTGSGSEGFGGMNQARHFVMTGEQEGILWFYLFVSLWIIAFTEAFYQFMVAYAIADYYYSPLMMQGSDEKDVSQCEALCHGFRLGSITHAGSIAFGSLIIALIQFIQKILEYANKKNQEAGGNAVITCVIAALLCCFKCCEHLISEINKNAYIDIAVSGNDDFCAACKRAMQMIIEMAGAMFVLNGATYVFTLFGTLFITAGCGGVAYLVVTQSTYGDMTNSMDSVPAPYAVMGAACVIGFVISLCFMAVFDMTSDTLIYCVGYDRWTRKNPATHAPQRLLGLFDEGDKGFHGGAPPPTYQGGPQGGR